MSNTHVYDLFSPNYPARMCLISMKIFPFKVSDKKNLTVFLYSAFNYFPIMNFCEFPFESFQLQIAREQNMLKRRQAYQYLCFKVSYFSYFFLFSS